MKLQPNILVLGDKGRLGRTIIDYVEQHEIGRIFTLPERLPSPSAVYLLDKYLVHYAIDLIINCIAYTNVVKAETEQSEASEANAVIPLILGQLSRERGIELWHFSTDYVFDGNTSRAYDAYDDTNPLNHYGKSKRLGELYISQNEARSPYKIFRVSSLYYPNFRSLQKKLDVVKPDFVQKIIRLSEISHPKSAVFTFPPDQYTVPTNAMAAVKQIFKIYSKGIGSGIYHVTQEGGFGSWFEFASLIVDHFNLPLTIGPEKSDTNQVPKRPKFSVLRPTSLIAHGIPPMDNWIDEFTLAYSKSSI